MVRLAYHLKVGTPEPGGGGAAGRPMGLWPHGMVMMELPAGFEPASWAYKARALPVELREPGGVAAGPVTVGPSGRASAGVSGYAAGGCAGSADR